MPPRRPASADPQGGDSDRWERALRARRRRAPTDTNAVRLLLDAGENFPAWLEAIGQAQRYILFESYIIANDRLGQAFVDALAAKARAGLRVCVVYDWLGSYGGRSLWAKLREAGVEVRGFNPPRFDSPSRVAVSRDHRKSIVVDGEVGFVSGLCVELGVGRQSGRNGSSRGATPAWRSADPRSAELEHAFAEVWQACGGTALGCAAGRRPGSRERRAECACKSSPASPARPARIVSTCSSPRWRAAPVAHRRLFRRTSAYTQALRAAAADGVDVRLLVPGASDIPALSPLSRAGYRPLLEAGVRVFEWNGTMLHAKTAVADGTWARVGSTNLNLASWMSNYELDVAIEDAAFAQTMAAQYERDLGRATEIVLTRRNRVRRTEPRAVAAMEAGEGLARRAPSGSAGRAAAGAVSVGSALGAALTNRRTLGPAEAGLLATMAIVVLGVAAVAALWPRVLAWPIAVIGGWLAMSWLVKAWSLWRRARHARDQVEEVKPVAPRAGPMMARG